MNGGGGENGKEGAIEISLSLFSLFLLYMPGQVILPVVVDVVGGGGGRECIFEHLNDLVARLKSK